MTLWPLGGQPHGPARCSGWTAAGCGAGSAVATAARTSLTPSKPPADPAPRHRLNPRGNRKLNHALHLAAVTQVRHATPGRAYDQRKIAEGKSKKEALRALKRRISDAVWRQLQVDLGRR